VRKLLAGILLSIGTAALLGMGGQSIPLGASPVALSSRPTTYYYGNGCSGTTTPACSGAGGTQARPSVGFVNSTSFTLTTSVTVDACALSVSAIDSTTPTWTCAIYRSSSGTATLVSGCALSSHGQTFTVIGYNEARMSGCNLGAGTYYIVAYVDGTATEIDYNTGTSNQQIPASVSVTPWPSTFPASAPFAPSYDLYVKVH
jgi:hypothetical protein